MLGAAAFGALAVLFVCLLRLAALAGMDDGGGIGVGARDFGHSYCGRALESLIR